MEFKVFTLNCWGIPMISKDRKARMQAIAEVLATSQYDIVCLQEVWTTSDFDLIKGKVSGVLPYAHYFYSGVVGSGICILSRHPFQEVFFHQWSVNGYVHKLWHGDWFGGKGVGLCKLKVNGFNINVYSAHLHAEYNRKSDEYQAHRVLQAYDTAQFIELTSSSADLVVLAGDLNTEPGDLAYRILLAMTNFLDAFVEADDSKKNQATTNESLDNSYTPHALVKKQVPGKRIDYVMYAGGAHINVLMKKYYQPLPNRVPHCVYSYSDHEPVCVSLAIKKNEISSKNIDADVKKTVLTESMEIFDEALRRLKYHKQLYWFFSMILLITLIVSIAIDPPSGFAVVFHVLRVFFTCIFCFTLIMASLWNKIECNAVLAGKLAMEVTFSQLTTKQQF